MTEPTYSVKEIIELQFKNLSKEMTEIKNLLKDQNTQTEKQFLRLDQEITGLKNEMSELKEDNVRYKTIWGIGATIGASIVAFLLNRIF